MASIAEDATQAKTLLPEAPAPVTMPFHSAARRITSLYYFDTIEHAALGNKLELKIPSSEPSPDGLPYQIWYTGTSGNKIDASKWGPGYNNQCLTYGQINALAGDFYAASKPISGDTGVVTTKEEMQARFMAAFNLMFQNPSAPAETQQILEADRKIENEPYDEWIKKLPKLGKKPSWIFATKMEGGLDQIKKFNGLTDDRYWNDQTYPDYETILRTNFDHFGQDAHTAYAIGHEIALSEAAAAGKAKDSNHLMRAYALNAFAEHYLEDAFSAGHIRTPRRDLHGDYNVFYDLCANLMHDEDGALGVKVHNKKNDKWTCFGDSYLHDPGAVDNKTKCHDALQASANEIWNAYHSTTYSKDRATYEALQLVPIPDNDPDPTQCAPLFIIRDGVAWRRKLTLDDAKRSGWDMSNYTDDWYTATFYTYAKESGWWTYEMSMDKQGTGD